MRSSTGVGRRVRRPRGRTARRATAASARLPAAGWRRWQRAHVHRVGARGRVVRTSAGSARRGGQRSGGARARRVGRRRGLGDVRTHDVGVGHRLRGASRVAGAEVRQPRAGGRLAQRAEPAQPAAGCECGGRHEQHDRRQERHPGGARSLPRPIPDHGHTPMVDTPGAIRGAAGGPSRSAAPAAAGADAHAGAGRADPRARARRRARASETSTRRARTTRTRSRAPTSSSRPRHGCWRRG